MPWTCMEGLGTGGARRPSEPANLMGALVSTSTGLLRHYYQAEAARSHRNQVLGRGWATRHQLSSHPHCWPQCWTLRGAVSSLHCPPSLS